MHLNTIHRILNEYIPLLTLVFPIKLSSVSYTISFFRCFFLIVSFFLPLPTSPNLSFLFSPFLSFLLSFFLSFSFFLRFYISFSISFSLSFVLPFFRSFILPSFRSLFHSTYFILPFFDLLFSLSFVLSYVSSPFVPILPLFRSSYLSFSLFISSG